MQFYLIQGATMRIIHLVHTLLNMHPVLRPTHKRTTRDLYRLTEHGLQAVKLLMRPKHLLPGVLSPSLPLSNPMLRGLYWQPEPEEVRQLFGSRRSIVPEHDS